MQKKLIAVAIAAISAAPAFAQSNVTIYGRVDYGYMTRSGDDGASRNLSRKGEFEDGIGGGSRLGFRGSEDLGNGLKAIFQVESGLQNDYGNNGAGSAGLFTYNRNAYVGFTGNFGTVVGGRLDGVRYSTWAKISPFGLGGVGNMASLTPQVDRADNAIAYISPSMGGFTVTLAHATSVAGDERDENTGDGRLYTAQIEYKNGPIYLALDHEQVRVKDLNNQDAKVTTIGGTYDFGAAKLHALWDRHDAEGAVIDQQRDTWILGVSVPFGNLTFKAAYGNTEVDENNRSETDKIGLGIVYALSKRTNFYADYGQIKNDRNAAHEITAAGSRFQGTHASRYGVKGFDMGFAHNF